MKKKKNRVSYSIGTEQKWKSWCGGDKRPNFSHEKIK
jgi:hypothetical protein